MKKAMISQPMNGLSDEEIKETREKAIKDLEEQGYEVVDTFFEDFKDPKEDAEEIKHIPVAYLAKSIAKMAEVDAVYFCFGWSGARGCVIEHKIAVEYGIETLYSNKLRL